MIVLRRALLAALAAVQVLPLHAQAVSEPVPVREAEAASAPSADPIVSAPQPQLACADCVTIPALTPITIQVIPALGSRISKTGDTFEIALAEPIVVGGKTLVPAGTKGLGEVIHAKKPGGSGAPGELILTARHLEVAGRQLRLRSMNFAEVGADKYKTVNTILIASSATIPAIAFIGFGISGKDLNVPAGALAAAKTAAAFEISAPAAQ